MIDSSMSESRLGLDSDSVTEPGEGEQIDTDADQVQLAAVDGVAVELQVDPERLRVDAEVGELVILSDEADTERVASIGPVLIPTSSLERSQESQPVRRWRSGGGTLSMSANDVAEASSRETRPEAAVSQPARVAPPRREADATPSVMPAPSPTPPRSADPRSRATLPAPSPSPVLPPANDLVLAPPSDTPSSSSPASRSEAHPPSDDPPTSSPVPTARDFTLWNGLAFNSLPPEVENHPDFPALHIVYPAHIWPTANPDLSFVPEDRIREIARSLEPGTTVCYDIEHWPLDPDDPEQFAYELQQFRNVVRWTREENPMLKIGFYGVMPGYRADVALLPKTHPRYEKTLRRNDLLKPLVDDVDVIFPWMYTVVDASAPEHWSLYVRAKIAEARRIAPGKPVYPFLWFRYHQSYRQRSWQMIEPEYWRLHLDLVRESADGAVIWGGYRQNWNPHADWWQVTEPLLGEPVPILWGD
ncbi:MAG: hypothetical protein AAGF84_06965 [Planctomycetota bacterium]